MSSPPTDSREPILQVDGLAKSFLGLQALMDFSASVRPGEILGLIGPNGAGKTTCFNLLTGFLVPTAGHIYFKGHAIAGLSPARIARLGIARTFQNIRIFGSLSVLENVLTAAQMRSPASLWATLLSTSGFRRTEAQVNARAISRRR